MERAFPAGDTEALVHGLAFLYLDGKLGGATPTEVTDQVGGAIAALLTVPSGLAPQSR